MNDHLKALRKLAEEEEQERKLEEKIEPAIPKVTSVTETVEYKEGLDDIPEVTLDLKSIFKPNDYDDNFALLGLISLIAVAIIFVYVISYLALKVYLMPSSVVRTAEDIKLLTTYVKLGAGEITLIVAFLVSLIRFRK